MYPGRLFGRCMTIGMFVFQIWSQMSYQLKSWSFKRRMSEIYSRDFLFPETVIITPNCYISSIFWVNNLVNMIFLCFLGLLYQMAFLMIAQNWMIFSWYDKPTAELILLNFCSNITTRIFTVWRKLNLLFSELDFFFNVRE